MKTRNGIYAATEFLCQHCGGENTHVDFVDVTNSLCTIRTHDDGTIEHLRSTESGRRHTITLHYYCEQCDDRSALSFQQHKGTTFVRNHRWRPIFDSDTIAPVFAPDPYEA